MLLSQKNGINRRKNFHPLERVFPKGGKNASRLWKQCFWWVEAMGGLFCQEGIGKRLELLDGVGLDG